MEIVELSSDERPGLAWRFKVLGNVLGRLKGLLGTAPDAMPVLLVKCSSIHTYGMRYALDVAFIAQDGRVLFVCEGVEPGNTVSHRDAFCVVERPASAKPWLECGERVRMLSINVDAPLVAVLPERIGYEY